MTSQVSPLGQLVEALAKAKADIKTPSKNKTGKVSGRTKAGKEYDYEYKYADRHDVIEAYKKPLSDNGLAIVHCMETVGDSLHMVLVSKLIHSAGAEIVSRVPIPQVNDAQALGKWQTYLMRYASCGLLDIAAEEDTDGRGAKGPRKNRPEGASASGDVPSTSLSGALQADGTALCPTCNAAWAPWKNAGKDGSHFCGTCRKPFHAVEAQPKEAA